MYQRRAPAPRQDRDRDVREFEVSEGSASDSMEIVPTPLRLTVQMSEPIRTASDLYTPVDEAYGEWRRTQFTREKKSATPSPGTPTWPVALILFSENVCYLCRYGDRIVDAGGAGSQLLGKMFRLIEQYHTTKSGRDLLFIVQRYVDEKIRPALMASERPLILPEFDPTNVLEHITTNQHTMSSRLLCSNVPRLLERVMLRASDFIFPRTGGVDVHVMEGVRKMAETMLKYHNVKPSRMAFGAARPDSLNIDLDAPIASAVTTRRIRDTQPVFVSKFLKEHAEKQQAAAARIPDDDADAS